MARSSGLTLPTGYLSASAIGTYQICPYRYYLRYIERIPSPPSPSLVEGDAGHRALERTNNHHLRTGAHLKATAVSEAFAEAFLDRSKEIEDWQNEKPDAIISRGQRTLTSYMDNDARVLVPETVEAEYTLEIRDVPVICYVDLEDKNKRVIDYKFTGRAKSERDAQNDFQLSLYSLATGKRKVAFVSLVTASRRIVVAETERGITELGHAANIIRDVADAISRGNFPRTSPNSAMCSARYCSYFHRCRGSYRARFVPVKRIAAEDWEHWRRSEIQSAKPASSRKKPRRSASRRVVRRRRKSSS